MTAKSTREWWAARSPEERAAYNKRRREASPLPRVECHGDGCSTSISSKFWFCRPCVASFQCKCGRDGKHYSRGLCNLCYQASDERRQQRRDERRLQEYGLTPEEYQELHGKHDGRCAGCLKDKSLHIDHDHESGAVRGLLCGDCNRALGLVKDNAETLRRLASYLEDAV